MEIIDHFLKEKQRFRDKCIQCGLCSEVCPILPYTEIGDLSPEEIQEDVYDFIDGGTPNNRAYTKAFACMECFKCATDICPEELEPMLVNELIKREYYSCGLAERAELGDQQQPDSVHRVLASIRVSTSDYRKISEPGNKHRARYVFFPGCNVYFQPEKILNALDIMDAIGDDYAFLPGLDYCCGSWAIYCFPESGTKLRETRLKEAAKTGAEQVVTVCHYCNQTFAGEAHRFNFDITNYVNLVAEAMGIRREDKFNTYAHWGDLDRILKDADAFIQDSPFDKGRIIEVLKDVFVK
jgi:Fe-S oxidoreductase